MAQALRQVNLFHELFVLRCLERIEFVNGLPVSERIKALFLSGDDGQGTAQQKILSHWLANGDGDVEAQAFFGAVCFEAGEAL